MCLYSCAKFEASSIIVTSFRQGANFTPPPSPSTSKETPENSTQISVKGYLQTTKSTVELNNLSW